ncbi:MBOAT family O-acyltransferase [Emcibacter nanhaiensis]|uniref:Probable alginate O-acetylase AlgI n=1 Tax=Emcibacter nanhaiensis TaxID=1505037 RepID=A0A501PH42_9PROT|nr:MBOAT family protein [Emcibacter nanhaiensis]TPD59398.1 MBOAT family protein [Emcibacter nanhaiensis]
MLFNSYEFIFAFLPVTVALFFLISRFDHEKAIGVLVLASLFFYGWWNPKYLFLIILSMGINYGVGRLLGNGDKEGLSRKTILTLGIVFNLGLLGYYKYAGFFVSNVAALTGLDWQIGTIVLPLAISFFTFQQIAYLVDAYEGITKEYKFLHYALFVTFFPQLIAGPIVHHKEMLPQFMQDEKMRLRLDNITIGLMIFSIGLFKKAVLADGVAVYATPVFKAAGSGAELGFFEAWGGALAYTLQLYFDFSGYSDMAIGAARLFGIRLPLNFHSPYKALSIVEFWRRWHMTLSRFLRDYVYIPLGGNRKGKARRYVNLSATMLLGGLWHGAGWTFVIWGALHGLYLVINHGWHFVQSKLGLEGLNKSFLWRGLAWALTFLAVVLGWVFFRAEDFDTATTMLAGMSGANGISIPNGIAVHLGPLQQLLSGLGIDFTLGGGSSFVWTWTWIIVLLPAALLLPNTQQIMDRFGPAYNRVTDQVAYTLASDSLLMRRIRFRPSLGWAAICALMTVTGLLALSQISEFLYFQF